MTSSTPVSYSYGRLERAHRWHLLHISTNSVLMRASGPFTLKEVQGGWTRGIKRCFRFTDLFPELQLRVLEMMCYGDLQCLALTSKAMQGLVSSRTRLLDATLFRSTLSLSADLASSPPRESQHGKYDKRVEFHPIIGRIKHRHDPWNTWEDLLFQLCDPHSRDKRHRAKRPLAQLRELGENAIEPPCHRIKLSFSSERSMRSEFDEDSDEESEPQPLVPQITIAEGSKDADGRPLPITVEQYVRAHLLALSKEPDFTNRNMSGFIFMFWKTQYIDETGCLHLLDAQWRRRRSGLYEEKTDGGYSTGSDYLLSDYGEEGASDSDDEHGLSYRDYDEYEDDEDEDDEEDEDEDDDEDEEEEVDDVVDDFGY